MSSMADAQRQVVNAAVLTVSDTRTTDNDTSGQYLVDALAEDGHVLMLEQPVQKNERALFVPFHRRGGHYLIFQMVKFGRNILTNRATIIPKHHSTRLANILPRQSFPASFSLLSYPKIDRRLVPDSGMRQWPDQTANFQPQDD